MADLYETLATPARRAILDALHERDGQTLFELCVRLSLHPDLALTRQAVSQHLGVLEAAGLLTTRREGRYKYHYLDTTPLHAIVERWLRKPLPQGRRTMKIVVTSLFVDDQEKALRFYTDTLGFEKKNDVPVGAYRWLTVVSSGDANGVELLLEPSQHPAVGPFKTALVEDGIPYTSFGVEDVQAEYTRLQGAGVRFTQPPVAMGPVTTAVFDDTCGNLIQIAQYH